MRYNIFIIAFIGNSPAVTPRRENMEGQCPGAQEVRGAQPQLEMHP